MNQSDTPSPRFPASSVVAVLCHPELWWTVVRVVFRLAPTGWWRTRPYLPLPDPAYLRYRMVTAYGGDGSHPPDDSDLITYLQWCRSWPAVIRR